MTSPKSNNDPPNYLKPRSSTSSSSSNSSTNSTGSLPSSNTDSPTRTPRKKTSIAMNRNPTKPGNTPVSSRIRKSMIRNEVPNSNAGLRNGSGENLNTSENESNIRVYVRCRGRNAREIKENSGVVVTTTGGIKNKDISVQTGTTSYTNKSYTFDRVFGAEADQDMVYDEVANKSLDEMLQGFNCTIFAYGQTGTGKTYTMTGDMDTVTNSSRPEEKSGIIPRVLFNLFKSLSCESKKRKVEHSVKLSYIELYNEELRDLIASEGEDDKKVKIYDDSSKKGVLIHGMEEAFVKNVEESMEVLRLGSIRRQVASTGCNDQSSRSHSVFTITVHIKEISDLTGQEFVKIGKLNLVDLAGSENISRSGAENKRAREAGMINQSLLTLGRVINSLVDRSPHIPYRESKLTRILQDSLGGRTKTCIIATISPAKVSLDETLSTLEYASRAKSIKNKPQANQTMSKQTHIMEYVMEIERLKQDLHSSRQKNGVYLSSESHQALIDESESRRIQVDEQKMRLDVVEHQLREAKKKSDTFDQLMSDMQRQLDEKSIAYNQLQQKFEVAQDELVISKRKLDQEIKVRQAHETTESKLHSIGTELISKLTSTVEDVDQLHSKLSRTVEVNKINKEVIIKAKKQVYTVVENLEVEAISFRDNFTAHNQVLHETVGELIESMSSNLTTILNSIQTTTTHSQESNGNIVHAMVECENDTAIVISEIGRVKETLHSSVLTQLRDIENTLFEHLDVVLGSIRNQYNYTKDFFERTDEEFTQLIATQNESINNQRLQVDEIIRGLGQLTNDITNVTSKYNEQQSSRLLVEISSTDKEQELLVNHIQAAFQDLTSKINILADERRARLNENYELSKKQLTQISTDLAESSGNIISDHVTPLLDNQKESLDRVNSDNEKIRHSMKESRDGSKSFAHQIYRQMKDTKGSISNDIKANINEFEKSISCLDPFADNIRQVNHNGFESIRRLVELSSNDINQSLKSIESDVIKIESKVLDSSEGLATKLGEHHNLWQGHQHLQTKQFNSLKEYSTDSIQAKENQPTGFTPSRKAYTYPQSLPKTLPRDRITKDFAIDENVEPRDVLMDININSV